MDEPPDMNLGSKSMSNAVVEPIFLGLAVNLAPIIRLVLPKRWNGRIIAAILLIVACGVGAGIISPSHVCPNREGKT